MNKAGFLFLGAVISAGSVLFVGCGGESTGTGGAGGGSDTSSTAASTSASTAASTSASTSGSGGGTKATAATYCKDNLANCTGDNAQYADAASCEKIAATFPQGDLGAMAGDSLECRAYHTGAAKTTPATHCAHSGITGGDLDPTATGPSPADGPCGDGVEAFCKLAVATCTGANVVWADEAACKVDAVKFAKSTAPFSTKATTGNDFNCRAYHLTAAVTTPATHCAHIKLDSAVCK